MAKDSGWSGSLSAKGEERLRKAVGKVILGLFAPAHRDSLWPLLAALESEIVAAAEKEAGREITATLREHVKGLEPRFIICADEAGTPDGNGTLYWSSGLSSEAEDLPPDLDFTEIVKLLAQRLVEEFGDSGRASLAARLRQCAEQVERGDLDPERGQISHPGRGPREFAGDSSAAR